MRSSQVSYTSRLLKLFAVVVFALLPLAAVRGDPVMINSVSGSATLLNGSLSVRGTANIAGDGFSAGVSTFNGAFGLAVCSIARVTGCTTANLGWFSSDLAGGITFNGMTFIPDANHQMFLNFTSITFVIPPEFLNASAIQITAPFTFNGRFSTIESPTTPVVLAGEGTVNLLLVNRTLGGINGFFLDHADYVFGPKASSLTIEPVPEPATILLLTSGVGGLILRSRRRT
jgi:hypothetical protein